MVLREIYISQHIFQEEDDDSKQRTDLLTFCGEFTNKLTKQSPLSQSGKSPRTKQLSILVYHLSPRKAEKQRGYCQPKRHLTFRWKRRLACNGPGRRFSSSCTGCCGAIYSSTGYCRYTKRMTHWCAHIHSFMCYARAHACVCGGVCPCLGKDTFNRLIFIYLFIKELRVVIII